MAVVMAGLRPGHPRLYLTQGRGWPGQAPRGPGRFMLHAALSMAGLARASRRRRAARVAFGSKSKVGCCGFGVGLEWRSSAIDRRSIKFVRISLAKASGLA